MPNNLVPATLQAYRMPDDREMRIVAQVMLEFSQFTTWRNTFAGQWEEAAALIDPNSRNTFYYNNFNFPGMKKTEQQIDSSGGLALDRFVAIADSLVTPKNDIWHGLEAGADYEYLMRNRSVRLWYEAATAQLFRFRYAALANFASQNSSVWRSLGAFGNGTMFVDKLDGRHFHNARGLRYKAVPLGETFYGENHQGLVDRMYRWFRLTAAQAAQKWGRENLPAQLQTAFAQNSQWPFNFLHVVKPREDDYDPEALDHRGLPFMSLYVCIEGQCLMQKESGFRVFPYAVSRYAQAPNEPYGRGPAQIVLPSLKTLNAQKAVFLKQGHRAADPVLLAHDDGIMNFSLRPGAVNKGAMSQDGKRLVDILPHGDIQISEEMMKVERDLIDDVFLVSLFKVLSEHPNMTATQVIELVNEKGMLVSPTLGRQHPEYIGSMVPRELDLLMEQRLLPPMPPLLQEARGQYEVKDTSPLARMRRTGEVSAWVGMLEIARETYNVTQDPAVLDPFDFPVAMPEIAEIRGVPIRWMADDNKIAAKQQARAKAQQQKMAVDAMPAQAAMIKARAVAAEKAPAMLPQGQAA